MTPGERPAPPLDSAFVIEGRRFLRHRVDDAELNAEGYTTSRTRAREWAQREGYRVIGVASCTEQPDGAYIVELEVGAPVSAGRDDGYNLSDPKRFRP